MYFAYCGFLVTLCSSGWSLCLTILGARPLMRPQWTAFVVLMRKALGALQILKLTLIVLSGLVSMILQGPLRWLS